MLGLALYENILVDLHFAPFFLKKFSGGICDVNDLSSYDEQLYENLVKLKYYQGDFQQLSLTFSVITDVDGEIRDEEIVENGRDMPVTKDNIILYIYQLANFRLNKQLNLVTNAFLSGFYQVMSYQWIQMFNAYEINTLISGSSQSIDIDELRKFTQYTSPTFDEKSQVVQWFWQVLYSLDNETKRSFLKFVTSCSNAPLLGFKDLRPAFSIYVIPDSTRLPTSSTCSNLLKLPNYESRDMLKDKLIQSVTN